MSTKAQVKANRQNAKKSTGPKTPEGKAAVSQNAVKHGLFASQNVLTSENQADFGLFREKLLEDLNPAGPMQSVLAERIVSLSWRLKRTETIHNQVIDALDPRNDTSFYAQFKRAQLAGTKQNTESIPDLPLGRLAKSDFADDRVLERLSMYENRMQGCLYRTMRELQKLKQFKKTNTANQPISSNERQATSDVLKMQNKPNLLETLMNLSSINTGNYEGLWPTEPPMNKPDSNPISNPARTKSGPSETANVGLKSNL